MLGTKVLHFKKRENGFAYIEVSNASARAKIALQGAHIFEYTHNKRDNLLWLSETSSFAYGEAIRGGIPLCWPCFGDNNPLLEQHGFARTSLFSYVSHKEVDTKTTELILCLEDDTYSRRLWNYGFRLELHISISETLDLALKTFNTDTQNFTITQALHSYFKVSDTSNISIHGLEKKPFLDALTGKIQSEMTPVQIEEEVDRVYQEVDKDILLQDTKRSVRLSHKGSSCVVVWNPWIQKCARMSAMQADAYKKFVCIESTNAYEDFKVLRADASHSLEVRLTFS